MLEPDNTAEALRLRDTWMVSGRPALGGHLNYDALMTQLTAWQQDLGAS